MVAENFSVNLLKKDLSDRWWVASGLFVSYGSMATPSSHNWLFLYSFKSYSNTRGKRWNSSEMLDKNSLCS